MEEDAVNDEDRAGRCLHGDRSESPFLIDVEDRRREDAGSADGEGSKDEREKTLVVVRVTKESVRRIATLPISCCAGVVEAIHRNPNGRVASPFQFDSKFVGEGCLACPIDPVDTDAAELAWAPHGEYVFSEGGEQRRKLHDKNVPHRVHEIFRNGG
jgi:hypothetical protein